jgi:hypothetical protein
MDAMKIGDLVKVKHGRRVLGAPIRANPNGYGVILDIYGGEMAKVIWQGIACESSWDSLEMLRNLVDAADELTVFNS